MLVLFVSFSQAVLSQTDSLILTAVTDARVVKDVNEPIFNGRAHIGYNSKYIGAAYFPAAEWQPGTLVFQGVPYKNISLKYDAVADELVVSHPNGTTSVILFTPRIQSFSLGKDVFLFLPSAQAPASKAGIYQQLVKGELSLYAKRSKLIAENIVVDEVQREFINAFTFYILKDGEYHTVKRQKDIMALTGDKKKQINASLKTSRKKFISNPELAMIRIVEYYNQLSR